MLKLYRDGRTYRYIRTQRRATAQAIRRVQKEFPEASVFIQMDSRPNSKELWNAIKDVMTERGCETGAQDVVLTDSMSENDFLRLIESCNNEKFHPYLGTIQRTHQIMTDIQNQRAEEGEDPNEEIPPPPVTVPAVELTQLNVSQTEGTRTGPS